MIITAEATFEKGRFTLRTPVALAEGTAVRLTITPLSDQRPANGLASLEPSLAPPASSNPEDESTLEEHPLDAVIGIGKDGPDISFAERHDELLYGPLERREGGQP